jgi:DsbC/DsbD-like thiol-disulfide interchange protein
MKRHLWWIVCLAAVLVAPISFAEEGHVHARLVADAAELQAGESFLLGVLLEPDPGWHVYWRNPGEAGLATEIDYELPEGFVAGELQWPVPVSFEQPGGLGGFGYEDPVVLAAEVTAPDRLGASASVTVNASWLACKEVCVLGSAKLEVELPLRGSQLETSKTVLETWPGTLPTRAAPGLLDVSVTGGPVPESGSVDLVVWLNWKNAPGSVEFFPDPGPGLKVEGVRTQTRGLVTRIDFELSRLKTSNTPATSLRSLIVIEDLRGNRSAKISHISID